MDDNIRLLEPSSDHEQAAATMWLMYQAYLNQGFSETQAMKLCVAMIMGSNR